MSTAVEIRQTQNGTNSPTSENFAHEPHFATRIMSMKAFNVVCMVLGELIGTGALLFFGCMGTINWVENPIALTAPLNFGLVVMMVVQTFGHISFALLNPAVTITAVVYKLVSFKVAILLVIAQAVGACLGYGLLMYITPEEIFVGAGGAGTCMTLPRDDISTSKAFFIEFFLTCGLISMICGVWDPRNKNNGDSAPLRVGLSIVALSIAGGPFTGASMNPVRSLGPALWNWNWDSHWIYWVAPLSAGFLASYWYKMILWRRHPEDELKVEDPPARKQHKTEL